MKPSLNLDVRSAETCELDPSTMASKLINGEVNVYDYIHLANCL